MSPIVEYSDIAIPDAPYNIEVLDRTTVHYMSRCIAHLCGAMVFVPLTTFGIMLDIYIARFAEGGGPIGILMLCMMVYSCSMWFGFITVMLAGTKHDAFGIVTWWIYASIMVTHVVGVLYLPVNGAIIKYTNWTTW